MCLMGPNSSLGSFDDEGVMPASILKANGKVYVFYSGWNSRNTIPYHNATGIAEYDPINQTITRISNGPVMDRCYDHPYLAVTPTVWPSDGGFNCLYVSGVEWVKIADTIEPKYVIKFAKSDDLINWDRNIEQEVPSEFNDECFSNPCFCEHIDGADYFLFCSRNISNYRNIAAQSYKLHAYVRGEHKKKRYPVNWLSKKIPDINDCMQAYPEYLSLNDEKYILYNGNGFGQTGIGVAKVIGEL